MKIAAIDIGSNAARLLIVDVVVNKQNVAEFNKVDIIRLPLRLALMFLRMEKLVTSKWRRW
jgi:exopolyphosphatase/guanosine-5'-triphosphate,3'-diphosphate pyrophosphatase